MPSIDRNGVPIYFEDVGSGPPIVMGHSILCSGEMWVYQLPQLPGDQHGPAGPWEIGARYRAV